MISCRKVSTASRRALDKRAFSPTGLVGWARMGHCEQGMALGTVSGHRHSLCWRAQPALDTHQPSLITTKLTTSHEGFKPRSPSRTTTFRAGHAVRLPPGGAWQYVRAVILIGYRTKTASPGSEDTVSASPPARSGR